MQGTKQISRCSLMTGTFHIILTFMAVLAALFKDTGLKDIVVQSMIVAEGSVDGMFSGTRSCNRAVRVYKVLYDVSKDLSKQI